MLQRKKRKRLGDPAINTIVPERIIRKIEVEVEVVPAVGVVGKEEVEEEEVLE